MTVTLALILVASEIVFINDIGNAMIPVACSDLCIIGPNNQMVHHGS